MTPEPKNGKKQAEIARDQKKFLGEKNEQQFIDHLARMIAKAHVMGSFTSEPKNP